MEIFNSSFLLLFSISLLFLTSLFYSFLFFSNVSLCGNVSTWRYSDPASSQKLKLTFSSKIFRIQIFLNKILRSTVFPWWWMWSVLIFRLVVDDVAGNKNNNNVQSCPSKGNICSQIQIRRLYGVFIMSIIYILIQLRTHVFTWSCVYHRMTQFLLNSCEVCVLNTQENIK